jgi:hypothetical protein
MDDLRALPTEGWILLPGVVSAPAIAAAHDAWDRRMSESRADRNGANAGPSGLEHDPAFRPLLDHPRVLAAVGVLLDGDVVFRSLHGRSPPHGHGRQGLHIDWGWPVEPDHQLLANAFFLLDDVDGENGATRIVPQSHRWRQAPRGTYAQPHGAHPQEQLIAGRAGDVLVFSGHVWHAGSKNQSGRRRRIAIAQFSRPGLTIGSAATAEPDAR